MKDCREVQDWLVSYLNTGLDPYDFPEWYLWEWSQEAGVEWVEGHTQVHNLEPNQLEAYTKWLKDGNKGADWSRDQPFESAPYLTLSGARALPAGTWCVHFTKATPFTAFDRGATLEGLHLSTWNRKKAFVDCDKNFDLDEAGPHEIVWGFAFEAREFIARPSLVASKSRKYGKHALLFQTDCAVSAWHSGDEEQQVIFPLCSERNLVSVDLGTNGEVTTEDESGETLVFPSLRALIAKLDQQVVKESRP